MQRDEMERLIDQHLKAELQGDPNACVAMYTDDVVHDVIGWPAGPMHGKDGAKSFYEYLTSQVTTKEMTPVHTYYGPDFAVIEHMFNGSVPGSFLGIAGNGRDISVRMLHVWEFRDGCISRENIWLDGGAIAAQLTAP